MQLTLRSDEKVYRIVFDRGVVIAASSPLPADSVARVALTSHVITPAQVNDIKRRIAAAPNLDEVDVLAAAVRLTPDQARALRLKLVTQRAARTFSVDRGDYELEDRRPLPVAESGIDIRIIIYNGVRMNLSEQRIAFDLRQFGTRFSLKPGVIDDLARFGFTRAEKPVIDALRIGTSLPELEANHRELDPRIGQSVVYALASCDALIQTEPLVLTGATQLPDLPSPSVRPTVAVSPPPPPMSTPTSSPRLPLPLPAPTRTPPSGTRVPGQPPPVPQRPRPPVVQRTTPPPPPPQAARSRVAQARTRTTTEDPVPLPPPPSALGTSGGVPSPIDPHTQQTVRAAVPRAMIETFRTGKVTTVRPNALAAHEVVALIEQRCAMIDRGVDHFALLGLSIGAPIEDVHGAYVEISRHLRPKRLAELGIVDETFAAQRLLAQIGIAFTVLTDRIRRPEYIALLQTARRQQVARR